MAIKEKQETNLRQAKARAFVEGMVSEKDLKEVTEDGETKIVGYVTIKTSDVNFVKFNVNAKQKTNAGTENKAYKGLVTVMENYKSIAEVGADEADIVRVSGDISPFTGENGENMVFFRSNFFTRVKEQDLEDFETKSEFDVELFISAIAPELDTDGIETGRLIVEGWMPTYNGIEPLKLVAGKDLADDIESGYEVGQTVNFFGEIINNRIETVTEIPVKIGKPKREVKVTYKNDLLIQGASVSYDDEESTEEPYDAKVIKAAIQERENMLAERKAKKSGEAKAKTKPSGAARGRTLGF